MEKIRLNKHSSGSDRRKKHFECTSSGAARAASFAASDFIAFAVIKHAESTRVSAPEGSDDVGFTFVARFGFWFSKVVKKHSAFDGTEASAVSL